MTSAERWLRGSYAFFFAAILPLLCWGGVADPHHAHWHAHFIFAEPTDASSTLTTTTNSPSHLPPHQVTLRDHEPCLHPPGIHPPAQDLSATTTDAPQGQAVPATVLAQLLILVMWTLAEIEYSPILPIIRFLAPWHVSGLILRVPTPPPRLLFV